MKKIIIYFNFVWTKLIIISRYNDWESSTETALQPVLILLRPATNMYTPNQEFYGEHYFYESATASSNTNERAVITTDRRNNKFMKGEGFIAPLSASPCMSIGSAFRQLPNDTRVILYGRIRFDGLGGMSICGEKKKVNKNIGENRERNCNARTCRVSLNAARHCRRMNVWKCAFPIGVFNGRSNIHEKSISSAELI